MDLVCEVEGVPLGTLLQRPDLRVHLGARPFRGKRVGVLETDLLETLGLFRSLNRRHNSEGFHRALARFLFDRPAHKRWLYHPRQAALIRRASEELREQVEREEGVYRQQRMAEQELRHRQASRPESQLRHQVTAARPPSEPVRALPQGLAQEGEKSPARSVAQATGAAADPPSVTIQSEREDVGTQPVRYECVLCQYTWTGTRRGLNPCPKCKSHLYRRELPKQER
jgi:hypothetical protein